MAMRFILYFEFLIFNIKIIQNKIINILPFLKIKLNKFCLFLNDIIYFIFLL